jgi:hypothetical protein
MKVVRLQAQNIMRLLAVDIEPDGNTVVVSGKNAQGKSSVMNCIWLACQYAAAHKKIKQPLRNGEAEGSIVIDLGDYIVTRTFSGDQTRLKIEAPSGATFPSPQAMLDKWIGDLGFDPVEFANMDDKEQVKVLRELLGLDFTELDEQRRAVYEERTVVNRLLKEAESILANTPKPDADAPMELLKIEDLQQKLLEADEKNLAYVSIVGTINRIDDEAARVVDRNQYRLAKIGRLQKEVDEANEALADYAVERSALEAKRKAIKLPDRGSIIEQLTKVEQQNQVIRDREVWFKAKAKVKAQDAQS